MIDPKAISKQISSKIKKISAKEPLTSEQLMETTLDLVVETINKLEIFEKIEFLKNNPKYMAEALDMVSPESDKVYQLIDQSMEDAIMEHFAAVGGIHQSPIGYDYRS